MDEMKKVAGDNVVAAARESALTHSELKLVLDSQQSKGDKNEDLFSNRKLERH